VKLADGQLRVAKAWEALAVVVAGQAVDETQQFQVELGVDSGAHLAAHLPGTGDKDADLIHGPRL
jgi:hypothetical protein